MSDIFPEEKTLKLCFCMFLGDLKGQALLYCFTLLQRIKVTFALSKLKLILMYWPTAAGWDHWLTPQARWLSRKERKPNYSIQHTQIYPEKLAVPLQLYSYCSSSYYIYSSASYQRLNVCVFSAVGVFDSKRGVHWAVSDCCDHLLCGHGQESWGSLHQDGVWPV